MKRFYKAWIIMVMKNERGLKILFYFSLCFVGTPERPLADNEKEKSEKEKELFCFFMHISLHSHPNISALASKTKIGLSATGSNWVHVYVLGNQKKEGEREALVTCWLTAKSGKMVRKGEQPMQVQNQRRGKEREGKNRTGTGKGKGEQTWN